MAFDPVVFSLYEFLSSNPAPSFGLALSGGVDSMTLFYALIELKQRLPINFCVLHVDHGWRDTSNREASELSQLCKEKGVKFFSRQLVKSEKNSEDKARVQRYAFFKEIADKEGLTAVMLAHHLGDLAETVLKRFFEGASLENLGNLEKKSHTFGLQLWRPFLDLEKAKLTSWMRKRGLSWFEDYTNEDSKYLRSRMRSQLIPELESLFGKNLTKCLEARAHESKRLQCALEDKIEPLWSHYKQNIALSNVKECVLETRYEGAPKLTEFEFAYLVKKFFKFHKLKLSREEKALLASLLSQKKCLKKLEVSKVQVVVSSGRLEIKPNSNERPYERKHAQGILVPF